MTISNLALHAMLEKAAVHEKPRLFALYGTMNDWPEEPVVGWGMELPAGEGVLFRWRGDHTIHSSATAEQVLRLHQGIGDVELTWLNE